jgi:predicted site-specific integrase-resolvase
MNINYSIDRFSKSLKGLSDFLGIAYSTVWRWQTKEGSIAVPSKYAERVNEYLNK